MDTYGIFYKENRERLYAYLLRMTGEQQTALDLLQESFTRYLARYGRREYNKALLYTIARNAALDAFRRQKMTGLDAENCLYTGADPEQRVIDMDLSRELLKKFPITGNLIYRRVRHSGTFTGLMIHPFYRIVL